MKYIQLQLGFLDTVAGVPSEQLGVSLEDYYNGKFVPLSAEQEAFLSNNQFLSPEEVFRMVTSPSENEKVDSAIKAKMRDILNYDRSPIINSFFINGERTWLNRVARASLAYTISVYKSESIPSLTFWTTGVLPVSIELRIEDLENMLSELELYAKQCFDTTIQHKANIIGLISIEEIIAYDHTVGYPDLLSFNFNEITK